MIGKLRGRTKPSYTDIAPPPKLMDLGDGLLVMGPKTRTGLLFETCEKCCFPRLHLPKCCT
jgi:hypothetical protein